MSKKTYSITEQDLEKYYTNFLLTPENIAELYECSVSYIRRLLRKYGLTRNETGVSGFRVKSGDKPGLTFCEIRDMLHIRPGDCFLTGQGKKIAASCYPCHILSTEGESFRITEIYTAACNTAGKGMGGFFGGHKLDIA